MKRISLIFTAIFALIYGLTACQTTTELKDVRRAASLESQAEFADRFDQAFVTALKENEARDNLFKNINATDSNSNPLSKILMSKGIKSALQVEFSIAEEYEKVSGDTYRECMEGREEDPNFECTNIMDTEVYKKSMAIWMFSDYMRGQTKLAYERLSQIEQGEAPKTLINKISGDPNLDANKVQQFASAFKANFESGLKNNVERGFAFVSDRQGTNEFRRGAMNTLDYAAQAEVADIINEVNKEAGRREGIDINLNSLYRINRHSYKVEAMTGKIQPEELEAFIDVIKQLSPSKQQRKIASIGWHDVHGRTFQKGEFALTYDDGPKKSTTTKLLNYLSSDSVRNQLGYTPHATFFWQAQNVRHKSNTQVVARAKNLGYGLASHSYSHQDFRRFVRTGRLVWNTTDKKGRSISFERELINAKSVLEKHYGTQLNYFRLPYAAGRGNSILQNQIGGNNMVHIFWNINADDWRWKSVSPNLIKRNYIREIDKAGRGVILLHDIHENTVGPLTQALIAHFANNRNRYKIVPLEEGITETFINIPANGRLPSNITRLAPAKSSSRSSDNTPVKETVFPHFRKIDVGTLNVRTGPSGSAAKCGVVKRDDVVKIVSQASWFMLDTTYKAPQPLDGKSFHSCGSTAYISNGSIYSKKVK